MVFNPPRFFYVQEDNIMINLASALENAGFSSFRFDFSGNRYKIFKAGAWRRHTVVVTEDRNSLAFGWDKRGQLGSGLVRNELMVMTVQEDSLVRIVPAVKEENRNKLRDAAQEEPSVRHGVCDVRQIELMRNKFIIKEVKYVSDVYIVLVN
ncbi:uncharacterized protein LOC114183286 isoform X2 [Vigna unguiculata]|uniref:uncharacterized protein LOC114183286 isoform X2 n=1 Tax=Vigna unguiculata TaxID=3917 RepID=UPI001015E25F|nr:uncharacterized protein LOC114183286 isoform X2 [Vigna unguiculata]